jgi:hypothetical protein
MTRFITQTPALPSPQLSLNPSPSRPHPHRCTPSPSGGIYPPALAALSSLPQISRCAVAPTPLSLPVVAVHELHTAVTSQIHRRRPQAQVRPLPRLLPLVAPAPVGEELSRSTTVTGKLRIRRRRIYQSSSSLRLIPLTTSALASRLHACWLL